jgi:hypothetical protein
MAVGMVYYDNDADFQAAVNERRELQKQRTTQQQQ